MPRNFERRVEVMFPIEAPELVRHICDDIIPTYMEDNAKARILKSDGTYVTVECADGSQHRSQSDLLLAANGSSTLQFTPSKSNVNGQAVKSGSKKSKQLK